MVAAAEGSAPQAEKRRVREDVKRALRQLSQEQMAEESEFLASPCPKPTAYLQPVAGRQAGRTLQQSSLLAVSSLRCKPCALRLCHCFAGALISQRVLASRAFRQAPHAIIYVHCAKLREVDTSAVLHAAMDANKRWVAW
jgi:hypothetical protein